jgi:hypothetical protein
VLPAGLFIGNAISVTGFVAAAIAVCGFLGQAAPVLMGKDDQRVRALTVVGGLIGLTFAIGLVAMSAIFE